MFSHQLIAETVPSVTDRPPAGSLNDPDIVRRLLEQHTGFGQFRVILSGAVEYAPTLRLPDGADATARTATLEQAVLSYVPEDRPRVVEAMRAAIREQKGFHLKARKIVDGGTKVFEVIGDVKIEDGKVTELFGVARDVSATVEREAMAISRARLIRHLVEDMPVPVVVLDRALRVVACSSEWARAYGLSARSAALNQPLGTLLEVSRETTAAIIEALNGRTAHIGLWFYSGEDSRQIRRSCAVIPWQCGTDAAGGVMMVIGAGEASYASLEIADRTLGRSTRGLLQMLETIKAA